MAIYPALCGVSTVESGQTRSTTFDPDAVPSPHATGGSSGHAFAHRTQLPVPVPNLEGAATLPFPPKSCGTCARTCAFLGSRTAMESLTPGGPGANVPGAPTDASPVPNLEGAAGGGFPAAKPPEPPPPLPPPPPSLTEAHGLCVGSSDPHLLRLDDDRAPRPRRASVFSCSPRTEVNRSTKTRRLNHVIDARAYAHAHAHAHTHRERVRQTSKLG